MYKDKEIEAARLYELDVCIKICEGVATANNFFNDSAKFAALECAKKIKERMFNSKEKEANHE